jgi:phosphoglycerate dehydrogenase-like enzyme
MTDKPLLVLWIDNAEPYSRAIAEAGLGDRVEVAAVPMAEAVPEELAARAEALVAWRCPAGALDAMPRLRWLQALTAGVEMWLGRPDLRDDLVLTAARGVHRVSMPENILAALFHLTKPIAAAAIDQRESRWTRRVSEPLAGKTLGIIGIGTIGAELARKASALEIRVIGTRRSGIAVPGVDQVFTPDLTDHVLAAADFVLLLLPSTPETRDFMDARRLAAMRKSAYLLNFGRGDAVVDADLVQAVRSGTIAGAVLDVFRQEPLPQDHPFWTTPGISVWPHVGGLHPQRDTLVAELVVDNLERFLDDRALRQTVDRSAGY